MAWSVTALPDAPGCGSMIPEMVVMVQQLMMMLLAPLMML